MSEERLYTINEIIKDAGIARSTFDKFAETNNLCPVKTEKRGKKFYSLKDKEFVIKHYVSGKGKEEKEKFTNHKAEKRDEIVELLREQVQQLKQANEQLVHDNDILTDQLKTKDEQISAAHQLADQAQKLHLGLERQVKALTGANDKPIVDGETSETDKESTPSQSPTEEYSDPKTTTKKGWWRLW
ncbi:MULTISPECIES: transcriptional regulator [Limosilactobacillus]|uniref:Transcriptional regulator n=1 Tax=Limosilactobacillus reuteri TaxID=1598 RepID=A0AAW9A2K4_LIMRT|nr:MULTISPECIES: transcriptional regulator [Limosilactobacillus]MBC9700978.1 transcriptional regulator [Leuconostoc sp.]MDV8947605.1 transcriptional regulator [Limosilactobacillus reuteri]OTA43146.1 transcriptional regulator [Limosilactobacillus reuteri]OTA43610.1 transcriptional regulator [Limosilactobacillus reuteri]OTA48858.1 transcriptional regulator [Limosilactobacillus reuteri]